MLSTCGLNSFVTISLFSQEKVPPHFRAIIEQGRASY